PVRASRSSRTEKYVRAFPQLPKKAGNRCFPKSPPAYAPRCKAARNLLSASEALGRGPSIPAGIAGDPRLPAGRARAIRAPARSQAALRDYGLAHRRFLRRFAIEPAVADYVTFETNRRI